MRSSAVVVADIKRVLDAPEGKTIDQLTSLSQEFANRCARLEELNAKACVFLDEGSLCEAARFVTDLNLIDEYNALNFEKVDAWREDCRDLGLPVPTPLSVANADRVREFIGIYRGAQHLFATHRRLALARSDAFSRLKVLRQLQAVFPGLNVWERQIRVLETACEQELNRRFHNEPPRRDTLPFWRARLAELANPERFAPCDPRFLNELRYAIARLSALDILQEWATALQNNDEDAILYLAQRWQAECGACPVNLFGEFPEARRLLETAETLRRRREAFAYYCQKLQHLQQLLVSPEATPEELNAALEAVGRAATAAGVDVPLDVVAECQARAAAIKKRKRLTLALSIIVPLLVFGLFVFGLVLVTNGAPPAQTEPAPTETAQPETAQPKTAQPETAQPETAKHQTAPEPSSQN